MSEGDPRSRSRHDRAVGKGPGQAAGLLVEWVGWDGKEHDRTDNCRGDVRRWSTRCLILLLTRLRGSEQPSLDLPHPRRPARPQVPRIPISLRSACSIRSGRCARVPVQPDGEADYATTRKICHLYRNHHRRFGRVSRRGAGLGNSVRPRQIRI